MQNYNVHTYVISMEFSAVNGRRPSCETPLGPRAKKDGCFRRLASYRYDDRNWALVYLHSGMHTCNALWAFYLPTFFLAGGGGTGVMFLSRKTWPYQNIQRFLKVFPIIPSHSPGFALSNKILVQLHVIFFPLISENTRKYTIILWSFLTCIGSKLCICQD